MARKGENIFKRKDGRWEARFIHHYENGKAKYRYIYADTYAEAKARKIREQGNPSGYPSSPSKRLCTFQLLAELWLAGIKVSVRESTYTRYHRILKKYLYPRLGDQLLAKIDGKYMNHLPEELLTKGGANGSPLSHKTTSDILCVLKAVLKYGKSEGYPVPNVDALHCPQKNSRLVGIVAEEYRVRLEHCVLEQGDLTGLGILFTLFTGVRIGELCGLRWEDIDFADFTVHVRRSVERIADLDPDSSRKTKVVLSVPKTENSIRDIPIPEFLMQFLLLYRGEDGTYLLTGNKTYTEPHQYYIRYRKYLKRNHIEHYSFHTLRHTFATRCVEAGFDPKTLAEILGHANVTTTMSVYVHPTMQQKRAQMERLTPEYLG